MSFSLIADYYFDLVTDITPSFLLENGISLLLLDLDNTISPYGTKEPEEAVLKWIEEMRKADITPFIVSNTRKDRARVFAEKMGIGYVKEAAKPGCRGLKYAMDLFGKSPEETALAGDQSFTDVLAANRADVTSILVRPIRFTNIFLALRYGVELPFREMCRHDFRRK